MAGTVIRMRSWVPVGSVRCYGSYFVGAHPGVAPAHCDRRSRAPGSEFAGDTRLRAEPFAVCTDPAEVMRFASQGDVSFDPTGCGSNGNHPVPALRTGVRIDSM